MRKGQYEGFRQRLENGGPHLPDYGPEEWNETVEKFGAVVIGARQILVAYNVNVDEKDAKAAKMAGSLVRSTGVYSNTMTVDGLEYLDVANGSRNGATIGSTWDFASFNELKRC